MEHEDTCTVGELNAAKDLECYAVFSLSPRFGANHLFHHRCADAFFGDCAPTITVLQEFITPSQTPV